MGARTFADRALAGSEVVVWAGKAGGRAEGAAAAPAPTA
jgi:hypothetical protein